MKKNTIICLAITTILLTLSASCSFNKSVKKNFSIGLITKGDGINVDEVEVTLDDQILDDNTLIYGKTLVTTFSSVDGFTEENGKYYPNLAVAVISKKGDTVLKHSSLLQNSASGLDLSMKDLIGQVSFAAPIFSEETYTMLYTLTDLKGDGILTFSLEIDLIKDPNITINTEKLGYGEAYLFSPDRKSVITNRKVGFNDKMLFIFEGLEGFTKKDGTVEIGMTMLVKDDNGRVVLDQPDMFLNQKINPALVQQSIQASLIITEGAISNPVKWQIKIWDKNSDAKITAKTLLEVE